MSPAAAADTAAVEATTHRDGHVNGLTCAGQIRCDELDGLNAKTVLGPQSAAQGLVCEADPAGFSDVPPELLSVATWRAFTGDTTASEAAGCFWERFGCWPAYVTRGMGGLVLAGPCSDRDPAGVGEEECR